MHDDARFETLAVSGAARCAVCRRSLKFYRNGVRMRRSVALLRALGRARRRRDDAARSYATIRGAAVRFVDLRRAKKGEILKFRSQMINVK